MSNKSNLTSLIIQHEHLTSLHSGTNQTLANLRSKYWIIQGKKTVKRVLKNCFYCQKYERKTYSIPPFGLLPDFRTEKTLPFINIEINFAGPFFTNANITSKSQDQIETYICLFVCATSRVIYLEQSLDFTTDSFIETFLSLHIYSWSTKSHIHGQWKNHSKRRFKSLAKFFNGSPNPSFSYEELFSSDIHWNFIPPRFPWWGGFYERIVQMVKRCLKKTISDQCLNYI